MVAYTVRRILMMIPTLIVISMVSFLIIQLPPGNYADALAASLVAQGGDAGQEQLEVLIERYGLDQPVYVQYVQWMKNILLHGDFGQSFVWNRPVSELIWERLGLTFLISLTTILFTWIIAIPAGIYTAVRQYSAGDYVVTFLNFIGLAIPNFLLALVLMYAGYAYFGQSVGGLFSPEYSDAPWSWERVKDLMAHLWVPVIVLGTAGTARLIRIMRANLLDELPKAYVTTARAKGLSEFKLLWKYPVRIALNPFISTVGWTLPRLVSGAIIVSVVLSLPTTGPLFLNALKSQDMYLAGSFVLLLSTLTVVGTLISDLLLAWLDPRIRYR